MYGLFGNEQHFVGYCASCGRSITSLHHHSKTIGKEPYEYFCERCKPMNSLLQSAELTELEEEESKEDSELN